MCASFLFLLSPSSLGEQESECQSHSHCSTYDKTHLLAFGLQGLSLVKIKKKVCKTISDHPLRKCQTGVSKNNHIKFNVKSEVSPLF